MNSHMPVYTLPVKTGLYHYLAQIFEGQ